jgi:hypothetical protein
MRMWTKSACVVLAWGILLILVAVGMRGSVRPVQANIRIASSTTNVPLTSTLNVAAASVKATSPGAGYVLQPGDTLSGIATALAVPGGWHHAAPARTSAPAPVGMPRWLTIVLMAVGLLIGAVCPAELVLGVGRRRRPPATRDRRFIREESRIVLADYGRLVVTHNKADGTVYVLRPPSEDPGAILRVARLVLKEDLYQELAVRLGVPANWPRE